MQICVKLVHNIMIHKCYFLGLFPVISGIQHKNIVQETTERLAKRLGYIVCNLYFGVICCLIDNASCIFYRSNKAFFKVHSLLKISGIGDQQAYLKYRVISFKIVYTQNVY